MLPDGEKVRQNLGGVELVGKAVEHGHPGVLGQLLHDLLAEAPVLDAVKHAAQDPCGVGNGLLDADLGAGGSQVGGSHAQILGGHLKGAEGAGGGLFKNQGNVLPLQVAVGDARLLLGLQVRGGVQELVDLSGGEVQELQEMGVVFHRSSSFHQICGAVGAC